MGSNTIIAIVVGAVMVIVGFTLWPVLNGASNSLYAYFRDSCDDGNGTRFLRSYLRYHSDESGHATATLTPITALPSEPESIIYYARINKFGGAGIPITGNGQYCHLDLVDSLGSSNYVFMTFTDNASVFFYVDDTGKLANEYGESLPVQQPTVSSAPAPYISIIDNQFGYDVDLDHSQYRWVKVAPMLQRFAGINNLLLTILPVVSIAGFLGISGAKLYSYGKGTASIGSSISTSVFTLIGIVVAMVIAGPIMGAAVDANQVVVSGQYQVNGTFGNIIQLLFAMIPVVYIAGLVTLVGLQARTALMGSQG